MRFLFIFFVCVMIFVGCLTPPSSSEVKKGLDYFPLDVNRSWTFEKKSGNQTIEMTYEILQEKDDVFLMRVQSGEKEENASFHLRQQSLFLVRGTFEGREEAQFLASPLTPGKSWDWSTGTATVFPEETVQVPAGSFQAIPVEYQRNQKIPAGVQPQEQTQGRLASLTERIWFVRAIGWIRIEQRIDGERIALHELIRYAPKIKEKKE